MKKFIPVPESFFFAPERRRVVQQVKVINNGDHVAGHSVYQHDHSPTPVLFWCEHSDDFIVKSYPIKVLNAPGVFIDFKEDNPVYHFVNETIFQQANVNVIKDCKGSIDLFYAHKRPDLMGDELVIVPEQSMQFLIEIFKNN
jgi:hypothetical protein